MEKRPLKNKKLKIIDLKDTYYATFDGTKFWTIEKYIYKLLNECDGKKTFEDIAKKVADRSGLSLEEVKIGLKPIFDEFERVGFIKWV